MGSFPASGHAAGRTLPDEPRRPYLRLQQITVYVRSLEQSVAFYVERLGFRIAYDGHAGSLRWVGVAPPDGTAVLSLTAPNSGEEGFELIGRTKWIAFITEDVLALYREWSERGVHFHHPPHTPVWGGTFTSFEDPDGNSFGLVGFDAITRQIEAERKAMAEKAEGERRAARDMEIAKEVQARLFPQQLPACSTLDYAGLCMQARKVGGDYYDFLQLGRERIGLVMGDIAGKGIAAALLMANLQANLRNQCAVALDHPQQLLSSVNRLFYENSMDSAYATLFFVEYDDRQQRLLYVNCGHLPGLLLRRDGTIERLHSTCTVLGLFPQWDCAVGEQQLAAGDMLALYTDGVTEAFNDADEEFGEQRLIAALRSHSALPAQALLASIADEVQRFSAREQHDDITLIVAKCREA